MAKLKTKAQNVCEFGLIGLGVMGSNILQNIADHGFRVAGYEKDEMKVKALQDLNNENIFCTTDLQEFIELLRQPKAMMMMVPAGSPVDEVIDEIEQYLESGDILIDGGNSYFKDTSLRIKRLAEKEVYFLGVGISGGEEGARHGASIMPGGAKVAYEWVRPVLESASAKYNDEPCVTYLGKDSTGHFVKMVHNGIEYALMQLISEIYGLMKQGLLLNDEDISEIFKEWNRDELNSYLIEITSNIFKQVDDITGKKVIDNILDVARQKGTGMWTSQSAMELQVPVPTIDIAVAFRNLSVLEEQREKASRLLRRPTRQFRGDRNRFLVQLHHSLFTGMLVSYAQGMAILTAASKTYNFDINIESVAKIWRGGCIIRSSLLEDIRAAYKYKPDLSNLLLDPKISQKVVEHEESLRQVVCLANDIGMPVMGLMVSLGYLDALRSEWLPANLIQAQRDYFGAHTYERIDAKGTFHTDWNRNLRA
jgi:6-phosphogluconate dehydrogenase